MKRATVLRCLEHTVHVLGPPAKAYVVKDAIRRIYSELHKDLPDRILLADSGLAVADGDRGCCEYSTLQALLAAFGLRKKDLREMR